MAYYDEKFFLEDHNVPYQITEFFKSTKKINSKNFHDYFFSFKKLAESRYILDWVSQQIKSIDDHVLYEKFHRSNNLCLLSNFEYSLNFGKFFYQAGLEIFEHSTDLILYHLGPHAIVLTKYESPFFQKEVRQNIKNQGLIYKDKIILQPGDFLEIEACKDVIQTEPMGKESFQLYLASKMNHEISWHYDSDSLLPIYCTGGKSESSRIQMAAMMLTRLGSVKAIPALKSLCQSKIHFIRWEAIKAILALLPDEGYPLLLKAKKDVHPQIRIAADKTLENWHKIKY